MVRACVDALIKGPVIAPQARHGLRRYVDTAQVMYDTLESMDCLGEMNTDKLEKMILRLPKWAQTKFREHLKNLERQGRVMPTLKDVVNFLHDRADVANHPFFSNAVSEVKTPNSKTPAPKFTSLTTEGTTDQTENVNAVKYDKKSGKCPMCTRSHPLYRCETFKSKPVDERHEFIKRNRICFNCINSVEHSSRSCKSNSLICFREEEIAFTADLEAMFHQVKVLPKDADALRFLWWSESLNDPLMSTRCSSTSLAPRRHLAAQTRQCIKPQMTMGNNLIQRRLAQCEETFTSTMF